MKTRELVIIGGGAAGLASAISAYEAGVHDILLLEKSDALGGILEQCIHNGFGLEEFKEALTGPEYADRFIHQFLSYPIDYALNTMVMHISFQNEITYMNEIEGVVTVKAKRIIYAAGCYERNAGAIMLPGTRPNGILTAGTAQHYLNLDGYMVGKRVLILGSGDIGLIMARRMHLEGAEVLGVVEIMPYSNGLNRNIVQCLHDFDIPLFLSHTVKEVIGKKQLEKVIIAQVDENKNFIPGTEKEFICDTLLLSVGLLPSSDLLIKIGAEPCYQTKSVEVNQWLESTIPGIFVAGNVLHVHDLVDDVTEEARLAGMGVAHSLKKNKKKRTHTIRLEAGNLLSYILPQRLDFPLGMENVTLKFRVKKPLENVRIQVRSGTKILKTLRRPFLLPSQMEKVKLEAELLFDINEPIVVEVIK